MNTGEPRSGVAKQDTTGLPTLDASSAGSMGSSVQEWTGSRWVVVEALACAPEFECRPLEPAQIQGQYVGQRVLTPAVPLV